MSLGFSGRHYLLALLDDATRVIPYAEFAFCEKTLNFLPVLKTAIAQRGIPERLYVDNGACYRDLELMKVAANVKFHVIHATARAPEGKGKIERFFRTVREQFLLVFEEQKPASLQELNDRLHRWIEDEYHQTPHRGIDNETPLSQWSRSMDRLRLAESQDWLDQKF